MIQGWMGSTDRTHDGPHLRDRRLSDHYLRRRKHFREGKEWAEVRICDRMEWKTQTNRQVRRKNELLDTKAAS